EDTGQFLGNLTDANGNPLAFEGLWAIAFGNGGNGGDPNALYFTAGINRNGPNSFGAADGLFGSIRFVAPVAGEFSGDPAPAPVVERGVEVSLSGPSGPTVFGEKVTFTATVTPADPNAAPPTGTVVFKDGDTVLGSAELNEFGQAVFETSA